MTTSRPWLWWFLVVFFLWSVGKDFQLMVTHQRGVDFYIFDARGWSTVFFGFLSATFLLDFGASFALFRPSAKGFWVCLAALVVGMIFNLIALNLALTDLEGVKQAYIAGRELRGMPANPEATAKIFTPEGMKASILVSSFLSIIGIGALVAVRSYFFPEPSQSDENAA
jgi:hypothetical protein